MIMVPTQNFIKHQEQQQQQQQQQKNQCIGDGYVGFGDSSYTENPSSTRTSTSSWYDYRDRRAGETCLGFDHHHHRMAEDESRSTSFENESASISRGTTTPTKDENSTKDIVDHGCWLQLGLGGNSETKLVDPRPRPRIEPTTTPPTSHNLVELNLFSGAAANTQVHVMKPLTNTPNTTTTTSIITTPSSTNLFFQQYPRTSSYNFLQQHEVSSWGYNKPNNNPWNYPTPSTTSISSSSTLLQNPPATTTTSMSMYYPHQLFQNNPVLDIVGPSNSELFKVIDPPRRPHSGVWVILQASKNQEKEPFLPQIPKNYLRIKDGRTTVRLLAKYLVNKLRLEISEAEVEIRCRGEELVPCLTLQHVRDNIWISTSSSSNTSTRLCKRSSSSSSTEESDHNLHPSMVTLLPNSSPTDHVMILHYARVVGENTP